MKVDKAVDMGKNGGHSPQHCTVKYFSRIGKLRFILNLDCGYPPAGYEKLETGEDEAYQKPEDNFKKEDAWEVAMVSKLFLNKSAKAVDIDFYSDPNDEGFDEEHESWMEEYKYSWPAFAFENRKPDKLFWDGIYRVRKNFIKRIFRGIA
jgi:hypothetical protein